MGRKPSIKDFNPINNGDMSGNITSAATNVDPIDCLVVIIDWTGGSMATSGTFFMDHRINGSDPNQTQFTSSWIPYDFGASVTISGVSGNHELRFTDEMPETEVRFRYVWAAGAGTLNVRMTGKAVGA